MKKWNFIYLFAIFTICTFSQINAQAATSGTAPTNVGIEGGSLSLDAPVTNSDFGIVSMSDGFEKVVLTGMDTIRITDGRGTGEGWRLNINASPFTEVGGAGLTLPAGSLTIKPVSQIVPIGTFSPIPAHRIFSETIIDNGSTLDLLSANINEGMGVFDIHFPSNALALTLKPSTTFIDQINYPGVPTPFQSTLTFNAISGP